VTEETTPPRSGMGARTSRVVEDAVGILEEELAHGIDFARGFENRIFARDENNAPPSPEAVAQRFRRDAHDIVDLAVDLLSGTLVTFGSVAGRAVRVTENVPSMAEDLRPSRRGRSAGVPTLSMTDPVAPGESADISMNVENDSATPTETFALNASDLISGDGDRIPAKNVTFTPAELQIPAFEAEKITVQLKVPPSAKPGTYSGLLQATKLSPVRAVLVVTII
jgi:hypothetical protein